MAHRDWDRFQSKTEADVVSIALMRRRMSLHPNFILSVATRWRCGRVKEECRSLASCQQRRVSSKAGGRRTYRCFRGIATVSLRKESRTGDPTHPLERALTHLDEKDVTFRNGVDQDASAFDDYIRALRLPHGDPVEAGIREKAQEEALVHATSLHVSLAGEMHALIRFALDQLPSIHDVILSDAIAGLRLLKSAMECLLLTAESIWQKC